MHVCCPGGSSSEVTCVTVFDGCMFGLNCDLSLLCVHVFVWGVRATKGRLPYCRDANSIHDVESL